MRSTHLFTDLTDLDLLAATVRLAHQERRATAELIASLAELDARRLYLGAGCPSLYAYCTRVLRLSEDAAFKRISAARAVRAFPTAAAMLADGSLSLATV